MLTLPARLGQFEPIDGEKFSMDEALERFAPILQELYLTVGNPVTDREKLFVLRTALGGCRFHSTGDPDQMQKETEERKYEIERACVEYGLLCRLGLIL